MVEPGSEGVGVQFGCALLQIPLLWPPQHLERLLILTLSLPHCCGSALQLLDCV